MVAPRVGGRAVQFMALQLFEKYDPALAKSLHKPSELRPFTVSSLLGQSAEGPLDPDKLLAIRLTALQQSEASILKEAVTGSGPLAEGAQLKLDRIPFRVEANAPDEFSAWNKVGDYSSLAGSYLLSEE